MAARFGSDFRLKGRRVALATALFVVLIIFSLLFALLAPSAEARASQHGSPPPRLVHPQLSRPIPTPTTYLALGDSLAFGYSQAKFNSLLPNEEPSKYNTGYVDDFGRVLRLFDHTLQIVNDGCPGETTESFIKGPCPYVAEGFPLHHPYSGGPGSSQLSDALGYLGLHPGTVNPITIDIGANDALGLIEGTCKFEPACIAAGAPATFAHVGANLGLILGELRAAAPHAQIVVLGLYNPFGETIPGGDLLTGELNEVMASVAAGVGARFADPLPVFNPSGTQEHRTICLLTNMCTPLVDIHPTDLGYAVLGGLVLRQYVLGLRVGWAAIPAGVPARGPGGARWPVLNRGPLG
ncbi:MAG TPA: SGNH/GDSL hydrolase family protein [Solirubrobacteraceae bacterium]|jgi:lysophospholipase L1-like esterase|nr:SGNH/GDSL hydrolase family protein [Solirubrobacteraceae bacterium]